MFSLRAVKDTFEPMVMSRTEIPHLCDTCDVSHTGHFNGHTTRMWGARGIPLAGPPPIARTYLYG
ncbi:hypothetical protein GCM10010103_13210 [Streptomyces paradoxus]